MSILQDLASRRTLCPTLKRAPNPPLNTGYIKRKWQNVPYALGCPRALMDIYLPDSGDDPFPVILFAHGGGFFAGSKDDYETYPPLEGLKRGYAVCAIDYTLSGEALFPRQIQEGKAALRHIRANAERYNLDTSLIIAWGMSAGANLVAMLATTGHRSFPEFEDDSMGNAGQPTNVDACMIWFCPTNLSPLADFVESGVEPVNVHAGLDAVMSWYFGMDLENVPAEMLAMANPETYIGPSTPPFVIQHGKPDRIVPYIQSVRLAERLVSAIGPEKVRLTIFEDYQHADRRFETMHNCSQVLDQLEEVLGRR